MKITPVAFDSMGVRSQATFVETADVKILIDPSASLGPLRFGYPPHKKEWERLEESWERILSFAKKADILVIGHYHYDHHEPEYRIDDVYTGKTVFVKHPKENINQSQKKRAAYFLPRIQPLAKKIEFADGREFAFGKTRLEFSPAVFHGTNPRLGYVVETLVDDGTYRFVHTNDVEGPAVDSQAEFILRNKPNLVIVDGPLSYIMLRYGAENMKKANDNLARIVEECPLDALIIDHHLLRDIGWRKRIEPVFRAGEKKGVKILTAAEYAGKEADQLEANRPRLWKEEKGEAKVRVPLKSIVMRKEE
ncbi:MAG: hypothetical protein AB1324_04715 [Candidatus Micrarchaeota archaeon]